MENEKGEYTEIRKTVKGKSSCCNAPIIQVTTKIPKEGYTSVSYHCEKCKKHPPMTDSQLKRLRKMFHLK